jgi:hypothetical protein
MAQTTCRRGREGEITFPAFAASERGEAPGPGAERDAQVGIAGAGSPTGAASRGRALEVVRCPLCGKLVRRHSAPFHALAHLERLERRGVLQLARENGGWVVLFNGKRYYGAGWRTLCAIAEGVVVSG